MNTQRRLLRQSRRQLFDGIHISEPDLATVTVVFQTHERNSHSTSISWASILVALQCTSKLISKSPTSRCFLAHLPAFHLAVLSFHEELKKPCTMILGSGLTDHFYVKGGCSN